ncbi:MAG: SIS domain-containing protein [Burkholderiaceae bacterium]|jgi:D-sedoheptulose 7-phosphate isomerase|nr:SIS domain-containing protein [Burkholderiaceae bacterium]
MLEQQIQQQFVDSADLKYQWADALAKPVSEAAQALLTCVTSGCKVMVCGNGASGALAQYMAALLIGGLERERPGLPALALGTDMATLTAVARRGEFADAFAAQLRALGQPGDVLVVLSSNGRAVNLARAVEAAQEREMIVIGVTGAGGGELGRILRDTDVHICVPNERPARVHECHQLILHVLCNCLDQELLGDEETAA